MNSLKLITGFALLVVLVTSCTKPENSPEPDPPIDNPTDPPVEPPTDTTTTTPVTPEVFSGIKFVKTMHLSAPRTFAPAVAAGSKIYFCGGNTGSYGGSDVIDVYDTLSGKWDIIKIPRKRTPEIVTEYGGKIVLCGGGSLDFYRDMDIYDTLTRTWTTIPFKYNHDNGQAIRRGDNIYLINGKKSSLLASNVIEIFNLPTMSFLDTMHSGVGRVYFQAYGIKDNIYIMGGGENLSGEVVKYESLAEVLNVTTKKLTSFNYDYSKRRLVIPRHNEFIIQNKIAFTGFYYNDYPRNDVVTDVIDLFDPLSNSWSVIPLKDPVITPGAISIGNLVIIAGGSKTSHKSDNIDAVNVYDINTQKWQTLSLSYARSKFDIFRHGNKLYMAAGSGANYEISDVVDVFELVP